MVFTERTEIKKTLTPNDLAVTPKPSATTVSTPQPASYTIVIKNKKLVEGPEIITVKEGEDVILKVTSDVADELHLHGYDKSIDLEKDKKGVLSFTANLTGRFVYELENSKVDIGAIEVQPK